MSDGRQGLVAALQREIDECQTAHARPLERIRINPGVPVGSMVTLPIAPKTSVERIRAQLGFSHYELLIHPADWDRLVEGVYLSTVERNMRRDGKDDDAIDIMRANAYANPQDFRLWGIPVVDDMPKVLPR